MPTSRPIRAGDKLTRLYGGVNFNGGSLIAQGGENRDQFVLQSDFGLTLMVNERYRENVCARVFGISDCANLRDHRLAAAITNGTAPGLYVREGDDTSNWEVYREVLARRVEEAMAARRGEASGGETAPPSQPSPSRQDDEIRVGDVVEVVSSAGRSTVSDDVGKCGRVIRISRLPHDVQVYLESVSGRDLPIDNVVSFRDIHKVSPLVTVDPITGHVVPSPPQTVAANVSPMPDEEASRIEAAVSDEVRRRISSLLVSDETTRQRVVNPSPPPPPTPPSLPSRFSLLEIDTDAASSLPQAPKASIGLAALQQELRAEREARRALAAAQTPPGRFDLLECDLPAVVVKTSTKATKTAQARPAASPPPPRRPVETITDLTTARSPLELARMLEGLNDELSTMMRQREAN